MYQARRKQLQIGGGGGAHINFFLGGEHIIFLFFFFFFLGGGAYLCKLLGGTAPRAPPLFLRPCVLYINDKAYRNIVWFLFPYLPYYKH